MQALEVTGKAHASPRGGLPRNVTDRIKRERYHMWTQSSLLCGSAPGLLGMRMYPHVIRPIAAGLTMQYTYIHIP